MDFIGLRYPLMEKNNSVKINIFETEAEVIESVALYFVTIARQAISERGKCSVALSGGNSPKRLYELLSSPAFKDKIEWQKLDFFFGDERYVPKEDSQSNYRMARETLFAPLKIEPTHIFAIDTTLQPEQAAEKYEADIRNCFGNNPILFDIILLGLGNNAHTASLFPHTCVLNDTTSSVKAVFLEDQKVYRITFTAPLINNARNIAFLVYGKTKAIAVQQVIEGKRDIQNSPAQLIAPFTGQLQWFLDKAAGAGIQTNFY